MQVADLACAAIGSKDWDALRPLLHPYRLWRRVDGTTIRGRAKVLAMLAESPDGPERPASVELRDDQIYRWRA